MPIWQRLLITFAVMLLASYLVGLLWHWLFNSDIPSYLSGAVGGLILNCGELGQGRRLSAVPVSRWTTVLFCNGCPAGIHAG
jgi:hypothetical protein